MLSPTLSLTCAVCRLRETKILQRVRVHLPSHLHRLMPPNYLQTYSLASGPSSTYASPPVTADLPSTLPSEPVWRSGVRVRCWCCLSLCQRFKPAAATPFVALADINSDFVEWQTHSRNIWRIANDYHLQIKITHITNKAKNNRQ